MLTEDQRVQIRRYLGWPSRELVDDGALETALNAIDTSAETQADVEITMAALAAQQVRIVEAYARLRATQLGSITLPGSGEITELRREGRRLTRSLAATLAVDVLPGAYFGGGSSTDTYIGQG